MAAQSYRLVMSTGPNPGMIYDLIKAETTVGRDPATDIAISELEVSRKHAVLIAQAGGHLLKDLGSTNGTFVNGQRLMGPHLLRPGETILLGEKVSLVYEAVAEGLGATIKSSLTAADIPAPVAPLAVPQEKVFPSAQAEQVQPVATPAVVFPPSPTPELPLNPDEAELGNQVDQRKLIRNWILIGGILLVVLLCVAVILFLIYIDAGGTERWCRFLGFLFVNQCP